MNDTELDEMLNQWDAPPAPASLRDKVRAGLALGRKGSGKRWFTLPSWHIGKGLFAGMAAGAVVFLVVIAQAFPQALASSSPVLRFPFVVESKVIVFADDGSSKLDATLISSSYKGKEIVVTESHPGDPLQEWIKAFHNGAHYFLLRYVPGLVMPESAAKDAWFSAYVQSGCVDEGETLIGHDTILNHATNIVQQTFPAGWRWTAWRAPDLGCFDVRWKSEEPVSGRGLRLVKERDAQRVLDRRTSGGWRPE